jgi:chromosome segregation ATPase
MNDTATATKIIHDTVHIAQHASAWTWQDVVKTGVAIFTFIGGLIGGWRYIGHRRLKAHEAAIVKTTTAESEADAKVIAAEAKTQVAVHRSHTEIILYWEKRVKELEQNDKELRASLALIQSQAVASERDKHIAEARLEVAKEKITALNEEIERLKKRIDEEQEELAELPALRNQVQSLQAKCELLQNELQRTIEMVQA